MENLTREELGQILDQYTNEEKYMNIEAPLPNGERVPLQDIQYRYENYDNIMASSQVEEPVVDPLENYTKEQLGEILDQYTNEDVYMNIIVELPDGQTVHLQDVQNKYNGFVDEVSETVENPDEDILANYTMEELGNILDQYTNEDIYSNITVTLPDGNVIPIQYIQYKYNELSALKEESTKEQDTLEEQTVEQVNNTPKEETTKTDLSKYTFMDLGNVLLNHSYGEVALNKEAIFASGVKARLKDIQNRFDELCQEMPEVTIDQLNSLSTEDLKTLKDNTIKYGKLTSLVSVDMKNQRLLENIEKVLSNRVTMNEEPTIEEEPKIEETVDNDVIEETPIEKEVVNDNPRVSPTESLATIPDQSIAPTEVIDTPNLAETQALANSYKVTFKNGNFDIEGYTDIGIIDGQVIHGPVIDPQPLNKNGKPKKITAKVFDGWVDENGIDVDLSQPLNRNIILYAKYKFDTKKAIAVGAGAAVGTLAYIADLAVPTPVPVVSMVGASGFGLAAGVHGRNLRNVRLANEEKAAEITAYDEIPAELQEEINEAKKKGYMQTFLRTAAISCTIASAAHGIKNKLDANALQNQPVEPTNTIPDQPIANNPTPIDTPVQPVQETTQVFNGYTPDGKVFRTAQDALNNVNGLNPYTPAFEGKETFEALYNGVRVPIQEGQSISSILESVGATDPTQVAINVMNADGVPLTWQSLADLSTETIVDVASKVM